MKNNEEYLRIKNRNVLSLFFFNLLGPLGPNPLPIVKGSSEGNNGLGPGPKFPKLSKFSGYGPIKGPRGGPKAALFMGLKPPRFIGPKPPLFIGRRPPLFMGPYPPL